MPFVLGHRIAGATKMEGMRWRCQWDKSCRLIIIRNIVIYRPSDLFIKRRLIIHSLTRSEETSDGSGGKNITKAAQQWEANGMRGKK